MRQVLQDLPDFRRRSRDFEFGDLGNDEHDFAGTGTLQKLLRLFPELVIKAPADYGCIYVDAKPLHRSIW
jgi:hypothetical protein